ncbi:hypothetical protein ACFQZ8_09280, partial [Micromonospora azadirachtae]
MLLASGARSTDQAHRVRRDRTAIVAHPRLITSEATDSPIAHRFPASGCVADEPATATAACSV